MEALEAANTLCQEKTLLPKDAGAWGIKVSQDGTRRNALDLLAYPDVSFDKLIEIWPDLADIPDTIKTQVENDARYASYIVRQKSDVEAMRRDEALMIPDGFTYEGIIGLSNELKSKLQNIQPSTLAQAERIEGMTPAALTLILAKIKQADARKSA